MLATNKNGTGSPMIAESMAQNIIRHKDKLIEQQQADLLTLADAVLISHEREWCGPGSYCQCSSCLVARKVNSHVWHTN